MWQTYDYQHGRFVNRLLTVTEDDAIRGSAVQEPESARRLESAHLSGYWEVSIKDKRFRYKWEHDLGSKTFVSVQFK